eukprot:SAG31_NODE_1497_length_8098_cov_4.445806_4_plen_292_part_00
MKTFFVQKARADFTPWEEIRIEQEEIEELTASLDDETEADDENQTLTSEIVQSIKVKPRLCEAFQKVWDSRGTLCQLEAHIWCPKPTKRLLEGDKVLAPIGHFITDRISERPKDGMVIRLRDARGGKLSGRGSILRTVLAAYMPHPIRFNQVWGKNIEGRPLYIWQAVPPSEHFIALGMLASVNVEPPSVSSIRCVPRQWVVPSTDPPRRIWADVGIGGRPGSIWRINDLGLFAATQSHDTAPRGPWFTLKASTAGFFAQWGDVGDIENMAFQTTRDTTNFTNDYQPSSLE